ncbi:hypothetical protein [Methylobacterium nodulans]|uniref:Uncharacterized protein n=1 Tax=Methylobacterium nodulans (strain LMG 21967 / CNCM I-2342 / ORS 2060) TaxID=460265 RepID=B8IM63_METNO|nr:hypothetical protein [Methylobacterium nodulans]ACL56407.1 hypothetical protein Mnod_1408 [Methylobacterium nodulans ORS 2060]
MSAQVLTSTAAQTVPAPQVRLATGTAAGDLPTLTALGLAIAATLVTEVLVWLVL